jgi:hypothetical protein
MPKLVDITRGYIRNQGKMKKKFIISLLFILILAIQVGCQAPEQSYPVSMPTPIFAEVPNIANRGEKQSFTIQTISGVECHAGIGYYDHDGKWITSDLPSIESDENGICRWTWEVPEIAKDGIGEFRGYIQNKDQSTNIFPATFCIEKCP